MNKKDTGNSGGEENNLQIMREEKIKTIKICKSSFFMQNFLLKVS